MVSALISKTVKIENVPALQFFYPTFKVRKELMFSDRDEDIIYIGPYKRGLTEFLSEHTKRFINTVGSPDLDFTKRKEVVEWIYSKVGKQVPNTVLSLIDSYDDDYFNYCVKVMWVTGKWVGDDESSDKTLFNLFQSVTGSLKTSLEVYYELIKQYPPYVVESSFLTFLSRVKTAEEQNVSPAYQKLLNQSKMRIGDKIQPAVVKMATRTPFKLDLQFVDLITDLR